MIVERGRRTTTMLFVAGGLLVTLGLAFFVSPLASGAPDGLEKVAIEKGFDDAAEDHTVGDSRFADYGVAGVEDDGLATGIAGLVGVVITFGAGLLLFGLVRLQRQRRPRDRAPSSSAT